MTSSKWAALPDEIQYQILSYVDAASLLAFARTSSASASIAQDQRLCEDVLRTQFPLAAARLRSGQSSSDEQGSAEVSWFSALRSTTRLRSSITNRKALDYFELTTGQELPERYAQNLGNTPRGRHHSRHNFSRLALFFTGKNVFLIVNLVTREPVEMELPSPFSVRDIFLEEQFVFVLTTRSTQQFILKYDFSGSLLQALDTDRADLVFVLANRKHTLAYSTDVLGWVQYRHDASSVPPWDQQVMIPSSAVTSSTTHAIDDHYFYQMHGTTGLLTIYDLDYSYRVSQISLFPRQQYIRSEVSSIDRHCYVCGPGQISHIHGLEITKVTVAGIPHDDETPIWDSRLLIDLGGWAGWFGDVDEAVNFGAFCVLPVDAASGEMLDCGRIRGPGEPEDQYEVKSVKLHGDHRFLVCVMDGKVLVWRLQ